MYFKAKKIWITGASSGIGEAMAYAFAAQGADLILSARNRQRLESVANKCSVKAAAVDIVLLDLEKYETLENIAEEVLAKHRRIDILINNGGISQRSLAKDTDIAVDKRIMDINFLGTVALTKSILPNMLMHQAGQIVTISSMVGKFGTPMRSAYAASKHALHGFFDALRAEVVEDNVKITMICPGFIRTKISYNALTGNGTSQNKMDDAQDKGMKPTVFAKKALKAIRKQKREVYIGGFRESKLAVWVLRLAPNFFHRWLAKAKVT